MSGRKANAELVARAILVMERWGGTMPTGAGGISRVELRMLERSGYVTSSETRLRGGTLVRVWKWVKR